MVESLINATSKVSIPTRPTNIVVITTIFPAVLKSGVIPKLNPEVVYAEIDSKSNAVVSKFPSVTLRKMKQSRMLNIDNKIIAKALLTDSGKILRPNISMDSLPLAKATIFNKANATEVTLTPPPVDPGDDPTHINVTAIINVGMDSMPTPTVSNPAVREELAIKNAVVNLPEKDESAANVLLYSSRKKDTVARAIIIALQ